ncbi:MAG: 50S ribosomal protein L22 [Candidatus Neomarinimicrobiota bacterium]|nr:MAG: 50S ribosomal protein L22 [Candidatus Neomarinimicrobiota bacterium]
MEAKAISMHVRQSPRKIRKTLDAVRGKRVGVALNYLHFSPEKAAQVIEKTLRSAVANFMAQSDDSNLDPETLKVSTAFVDQGPALKRFRAASMGRVSRIRRPTSHVTVIVSDE